MTDVDHRMPHVDEIDRQLIRLLQQNGRMSTCEIAHRLNCLSDRAVRYRLERLQRENVMHVSAIVNTRRMGFPLMGDVLLDIVPWKLLEAVKQLSADSRVCYIAASPDLTQLSLQVNGRDRPDLMRIVGEVTAHIEGITSIRIAPLSRLFRDVSDWVMPPLEPEY
jgi:Lrp/AsnC family transcriptional regulator, regulator for asnA, asnC and gidA